MSRYVVAAIALSALANPVFAGEMQLKTMQVNGVQLSYEQQGAGAPVVFIHGALSDARTWDGQREAVAAHHLFIAPTLRYFGTALWADKGEKFSMATHAEDMAALIKGLGLGPVHLVGWSYSGPVVLLILVQHPEIVKGVFLYEPAAVSFVTDEAALKAATDDRKAMLAPGLAASKAGDNSGAVKILVGQVDGLPDYFSSMPERFQSVALDNARTVPLGFAAPPPPPVTCQQLAQVQVPVTIARGELTRPFYKVAAEAAAACIPGAKLVVIPQSRHMAPIQDAEAFNDVLLSALP